MNQIDGEAGGERAVDQAVIVGESDRQNCPRFDFVVFDDRFDGASTEAENGGVRLINERCKVAAADATLVGNGKGAALEFFE